MEFITVFSPLRASCSVLLCESCYEYLYVLL